MLSVPEIKENTDARDLIPKWDEIPDEFKSGRTLEVKLFNTFFFHGGSVDIFIPKEGVDKEKALRVLTFVARDWGLSHEHKESGWAYLVREWFDIVH
jgi:hypothetical protein